MCSCSSSKPHRRIIRLKGYNYANPGGYFITICTQDKTCRFGEVVEGKMKLNSVGQMVHAQWLKLATRYPAIHLDEFVVMPNHLHAIIIVGATLVVALGGVAPTPEMPAPAPGSGTSPAPTLGQMVGAFKSITTHEYILGVRSSKWASFERRLWQRNYYEHIIRDTADWDRIRKYIQSNPLRWRKDQLHPDSTSKPLRR